MFDYSKLNGRIREIFGSQANFAKAMDWSERTTSLKLNNHRTWSQQDINKASNVLEIPVYEIGDYFFTTKVQ